MAVRETPTWECDLWIGRTDMTKIKCETIEIFNFTACIENNVPFSG